MNYAAAVRFLNKLENPHKGFGLNSVRELAARAGAYSSAFTVVHVAGTNGKGSTGAMIAQILGQKYMIGLYTSPHLLEFRERIKINGRKIGKGEFAALLSELHIAAGAMHKKPTQFEYLTVLAILYFMRKRVDVAVMEAGLGGRLDATNICRGAVNVFTDISLEHTETLGKTVKRIAGEKAGIIKQGSSTVVAKDNAGFEEISKIAREKKSKLIITRGISARNLGIMGAHQKRNAALAVSAVRALEKEGIKINEKAIRKGLAEVRVQGRMQTLQKKPFVIADVAHNSAGCKAVAQALNDFKYNKLILVFGCLKDKDYKGMLNALRFDYAFIVPAKSPRALDTRKITRFLGQAKWAKGKYETALSVKAAVKKAKRIAGKDDLILVCGSHYVVAEALSAGKS